MTTEAVTGLNNGDWRAHAYNKYCLFAYGATWLEQYYKAGIWPMCTGVGLNSQLLSKGHDWKRSADWLQISTLSQWLRALTKVFWRREGGSPLSEHKRTAGEIIVLTLHSSCRSFSCAVSFFLFCTLLGWRKKKKKRLVRMRLWGGSGAQLCKADRECNCIYSILTARVFILLI